MSGSISSVPLAAQQSADVAVNLQELQETVSRLSSHKGVQAVMILNRAGDIMAESIKGTPSVTNASGNTEGTSSSASEKSALTPAKFTKKMMDTATAYLKTLSEDDEISFLQIRSKQHREIMIAPHDGYVLVVLKC